MILFNHTSEHQKNLFFIKKLILHLVKFKKNKTKTTLSVGNLNSLRDWSHAQDIVKTCIKISKNKKPDDYFINSQKKISNRRILEIILKKLNIKYHTIKEDKNLNYYSSTNQIIVSSQKKFFRDNDYEISSKSNSNTFKNNPYYRDFMGPSKIIDRIVKTYKLN
jgi:GDP-D-mannose dehydratase